MDQNENGNALMNDGQPIRVLVIEDDQPIADFIFQGLMEAGLQVDIVNNGPAGLDLGCTRSHDVIILDLMLPGMDGLELLQRFRGSGVNTPVLILSARRSVNDRVLGLQAGGDDYLIKPFAFTELLARIRSLLRRSGGAPEPTRLLASDLTIDLLARRAFRGREQIDLLPQEFSLLEYLVRNCGHVVTRTQILKHVWGYNFNPSTNVVDVHICRLREKIERPDRPQLLRTVRGAGYILVDSDEVQ
jgi:two-component system, OmpR family, response regulator